MQCNMFHVTDLQFNYKYHWFIIPEEYTEAELSFVFKTFSFSKWTWKINFGKVFHNFKKKKAFQIMGTH